MPDTPLTRHVKSFADMHQLHDFEERAAIHQHDGKASLNDSERMAYEAIFNMEPPEDLK